MYLDVGDDRFELTRPISDPESAANQAIGIELTECLIDSLSHSIIHCKRLAAPVQAQTHPSQL